MQFKESELLYMKFTKKDQTSRFAIGIPSNSMSLNYFISNLCGGIKLRVSLKDFHAIHESELLYIEFTMK